MSQDQCVMRDHHVVGSVAFPVLPASNASSSEFVIVGAHTSPLHHMLFSILFSRPNEPLS